MRNINLVVNWCNRASQWSDRFLAFPKHKPRLETLGQHTERAVCHTSQGASPRTSRSTGRTTRPSLKMTSALHASKSVPAMNRVR